MNQGKKTIQQKNKKVEKKPAKKVSKNTGKIVIGVGVLMLVVICVFIGYEQLRRHVLFTVNEENAYMDEMIYYIYQAESQANFYEQFYAQTGMSGDYWNQPDEEGKLPKEKVLDTMIENEILYREAIKAGYSVSDEDKKSNDGQIKNMMDTMTKKQKTSTGFTKEKLNTILSKKAIAERYKVDLIDSFPVDDEAIKKSIHFADLKQYEVEYYKVDTAVMDQQGKQTEVDAKTKTEYYNKMVSLLKKAKTAEDFTKLIDEKDTNNVIQFNEAKFIESEDGFDEKLKEQVMAMENDEISEVVEGTDGYYIIKMTDNNSSARYDSEVQGAIGEKEMEAYEKEYAKIKENYKIKLNEKEWNAIQMGSVTM